ncbi:MAG: LCP family protein [Lachnospiraceae bacterium]
MKYKGKKDSIKYIRESSAGTARSAQRREGASSVKALSAAGKEAVFAGPGNSSSVRTKKSGLEKNGGNGNAGNPRDKGNNHNGGNMYRAGNNHRVVNNRNAANNHNGGNSGKSRKSGNGQSNGKNRNIKIISLVALALHAILSAVFVIVVIKLNVLLVWMVIVLAVLLVGLVVIAFFLRKSRKNAGKIAGMILSVLMSFILLIGSIYIVIADSTIAAITGGAAGYKVYYVAVLKDDKAESIKDAADYVFGTSKVLETEEFEKALEVLRKRTGKKEIKTQDYSSADLLQEALYEKTAGAIFYESSTGGLLEVFDEEYKSKVRIIGTIKIKAEKTKASSTTKKVDVLGEPFVIYISGNDQFEGLEADGRSDVNMLAVVNPKNAQVLLVSIPRDYYVRFPGVSGDARDKLTHCGIYGMDAQIATLEELLDTEINYFVKINFTSLIKIVDAIGGVEVYNPYAFTAIDQTHFPKGNLHFDGITALMYARERQNLPEGDFSRGQHQQILIEAMINQLVSAASITHYTALMDAISGSAITDMSSNEIKSIVKNQLATGTKWEIIKVQAKGAHVYQPSFAAGGMDLSVVMPYAESVEYISDLLARMLNGEKLSGIENEEPDDYTFITDLLPTSDDEPEDEDIELDPGDAETPIEYDYEEIMEEAETQSEGEEEIDTEIEITTPTETGAGEATKDPSGTDTAETTEQTQPETEDASETKTGDGGGTPGEETTTDDGGD